MRGRGVNKTKPDNENFSKCNYFGFGVKKKSKFYEKIMF